MEAEIRYAKQWKNNPEPFNPYRNAESSLQVKRSLAMIHGHPMTIADLGCGSGEISKLCASKGSQVTAVDIADYPLEKLAHCPNISPSKQWVPFTTLEDSAFDFVLALDLITEIPSQDHRIFISELARLVKKDGSILLSTALDLSTEAPLQFLLCLVETELEVESIVKSYHALWLFLKQLLTTYAWSGWLLSPLIYGLDHSPTLLRFLESITEFFYGEEGVSHVILLAKRRPLVKPLSPLEAPVERKTRA
jgi:2-polyprenyl-3-methyl-5-hydroxy-6-metoxy-1,4-benzoquinol methylase